MNLPPHLLKNTNFNAEYTANIQNLINQNNALNLPLNSNNLQGGYSAYNSVNNNFEESKMFKKEKKKAQIKVKTKKKLKNLRKAGGEMWSDPTLDEWPESDFRMFCGDLGNEVTDEILANAFRKYPSFQKARVLRDKRTGKTKGYGFISFKDSEDYIKAMREMNGKYVGNRPIRLKRSTWKDRNIENSNSKIEHVKFKKNKQKIRKNIVSNANMNMNVNPGMMKPPAPNSNIDYTYYER
jgi:RNA recognition motif-containing protein